MRCCRFAGYPGGPIKAGGQEGIVESAWVPIVPLWGTPCRGSDGAHVRPGPRPVDGEPSCPPARVESGKENAVKGAERRHRQKRKRSGIREIGRLLDEAPEDLPRRNVNAVTHVVIPADVHQSDEAAFPARNWKCGSKPGAVELLVSSSRAISRQPSPSADVSTIHDFR
jgi:hypothetical protein